MHCHTYILILVTALENLLSYSMILVEIATRSDLNSVSMAAISEEHNLRPPFDVCFVTSPTGPG